MKTLEIFLAHDRETRRLLSEVSEIRSEVQIHVGAVIATVEVDDNDVAIVIRKIRELSMDQLDARERAKSA